MLELTTAEAFADFIREGRAVVEFYTTWCPDCKRIEPYLPEWEAQYQGSFRMARANAEEIPEVSEQFDVKGIPSFLVFENGELVNRLYSRDAKTKQQVAAFLDQAYISVV
ncbi:thioredoxin family protein [Alicyclobacillus cycloheptanicus]|uniref:Thioredoxin-like negative regulator of GroEL n=1 Tax=Alicyclobacillus cycloheptanicus TaxID=1457 RepID=A0ABT9XIV3_9BACL|nr:thioredoxin family protein [Alicyclobacillus cycloheptanicus]MDQ0190242.1 thioredoxin-like negative regulator of GroEL [Alicyclobacillus cycloheptanicus]